MTTILGAVGADVTAVRAGWAQARFKSKGGGPEAVEQAADACCVIQGKATAARCFARSEPGTSGGKGAIALLFGDLCDSAASHEHAEAHFGCALAERPAAELLRRYAERGRKVVGEAHGAFAGAIYDRREGVVTLCRDRMGVRPLYYCLRPIEGVGVAFSTSLRALATLPGPRRSLSRAAVASFLSNGFVMEPLTMLSGVQALLPGESIAIDTGGTVRERAFARGSLGAPGRTAVGTEPPEKSIRARLVESIARQIPASGACGLLLSGGVDSSTIASVIRRDLGKQVDTFSLTFDDRGLDESQYSRAVAGHLKTRHHETVLKEAAFNAGLDAALDALDQPTSDAINAFYVARECEAAGIDVCLTGIASDELFGGHDCFKRVPPALLGLRAFRSLPGPLRKVARALAPTVLRTGTHYMPSAGVRGKLVSLLDQPDDLLRVYLLSKYVNLPELVARLVPSQSVEDILATTRGIDEFLTTHGVRERTVRDQISVCEQLYYLSNQLLRDLDSVSSSLGLMARCPFVDEILVDAICHVPPKDRFRGPLPKQLLIDSVKDILPTEAYLRPKQGFVLPIANWLEGSLASRVDALTGDEAFVRSVGLDPSVVRELREDCRTAGGSIFYTRLWSVFILLDWCRRTGLSVE